MIVLILILCLLIISNFLVAYHVFLLLQKLESSKQPDSVTQELNPQDAEDYKRKYFSLGKGVYRLLFLKPSTISSKKGKRVSIRAEFHQKLLLLKEVIGKNDFSMYAYIDNVLENHFNMFMEEIDSITNKDELSVEECKDYETFWKQYEASLNGDGVDYESLPNPLDFLQDNDDEPKTDESCIS